MIFYFLYLISTILIGFFILQFFLKRNLTLIIMLSMSWLIGSLINGKLLFLISLILPISFGTMIIFLILEFLLIINLLNLKKKKKKIFFFKRYW